MSLSAGDCTDGSRSGLAGHLADVLGLGCPPGTTKTLAINNLAKAIADGYGAGGGTSGASVTVADANYMATASVYRIRFTSLSAARIVTLPDPASVPAYLEYLIKDESGSASGVNTITVVVDPPLLSNPDQSPRLVDGQLSLVAITSAYGKVRLYSNGTAWFTE